MGRRLENPLQHKKVVDRTVDRYADVSAALVISAINYEQNATGRRHVRIVLVCLNTCTDCLVMLDTDHRVQNSASPANMFENGKREERHQERTLPHSKQTHLQHQKDKAVQSRGTREVQMIKISQKTHLMRCERGSSDGDRAVKSHDQRGQCHRTGPLAWPVSR